MEKTSISIGNVEKVIHNHLHYCKVSARWVPRQLQKLGWEVLPHSPYRFPSVWSFKGTFGWQVQFTSLKTKLRFWQKHPSQLDLIILNVCSFFFFLNKVMMVSILLFWEAFFSLIFSQILILTNEYRTRAYYLSYLVNLFW